MKILITGTAGFIGFHLARKMIERGDEVVGLDNINTYYDVSLKHGRLNETGIDHNKAEYGKFIQSSKFSNYKFIKLNLEDRAKIESLFENEKFDCVCNLAAQAGVRFSLDNPHEYISSNITGFMNILEGCRHNKVNHLVYASSSSVYGLNEKIPFSTHDNVDRPLSIYAATKKSNELMAHTYSHLYHLPTTGLRFFTVYGPWGRPDMAYFKFTKAILNEEPIDVYNYGDMQRDFTYIDDVVNVLIKVIDKPSAKDNKWSGENPNPSSSNCLYKVYNVGNNNPVNLMEFIKAIEDVLGKKALKTFMPLQKGDVVATYANINDLIESFNYAPNTSIVKGVGEFINWYKCFHNL